MALTREEVLHVATLARLSLEPAEVELFTRQLNDILAYVEKLQELDTTDVPSSRYLTSSGKMRSRRASTGRRPWTMPRPGKKAPFWCPGLFERGLGSGGWVLVKKKTVKLSDGHCPP
jgi:aspartyl-tRNA(Asn)/glutamyl-tRNA(Gln) amidotransferase subunit C